MRWVFQIARQTDAIKNDEHVVNVSNLQRRIIEFFSGGSRQENGSNTAFTHSYTDMGNEEAMNKEKHHLSKKIYFYRPHICDVKLELSCFSVLCLEIYFIFIFVRFRLVQ